MAPRVPKARVFAHRPKEPGKRNRSTVPPGLRRNVMARDGHRCRMKGCGQTRFLSVHHLVPRERGGKNEEDNLVTLCEPCHRLIHERYFKGKVDTEGLRDLPGTSTLVQDST